MTDLNKIRMAQIRAAEDLVIASLPPELRTKPVADPESAEPVAAAEVQALRNELHGIIHNGWPHPGVKPIQERGFAILERLCALAAPTDSQAGRDAVEAAAERAIEHALETAGVRLSLGYVLAVDAGMQLFQKFSRAALSTPTGRAG